MGPYDMTAYLITMGISALCVSVFFCFLLRKSPDLRPGKALSLSVCVLLLGAVLGILAAKLFSGQPSSGVGYEGDAIASNVLGGVSMKGGTGTHTGALIGALVLATLTNGFNLLQVDFYYQMIVKGFVIILAVEIDVLKKAAEEANISLRELLFPKKK